MIFTGTPKFTVNGNWSVHEEGPKALISFACEADRLGYDAIRIIDHVIGVNIKRHPQLPPTPYTSDSKFPEVFTLMAYLSAVTKNIKLLSGVIGLPQRQTALVAKQTAEIDNLSDGRLILGVGVGYNPIEFLSMGANFKNRGMLVEEQVVLLRKLWTQDEVTFTGDWHDFQSININPLPIQRPIPIWMGAGRTAQPVPPGKILRRIGKLADGFMPLFQINKATHKLEEDALAAIRSIHESADESGRTSIIIDMEMSLFTDGKSTNQIHDEIYYLNSLGASHIHFRPGATTLNAQLDAIEQLASVRDTYITNAGVLRK
jgi:probable F420-dependent oxidoreductase